MSVSQTYRGYVAAEAPLDERIQFVRRTYLCLSCAIGAFVAISVLFYQAGVGLTIARAIAASPMGWLLVLGGFVVVGYMAQAMARSRSGPGTQMAGLALYAAAEALIFSPLIWIAAQVAPGALPTAALLTLLTFGSLSIYVLVSNKDFTVLGPAIFMASIIALGVIVAGVIFGFNLGIWFSGAMILLAAGSILFTTSKVLRYYPVDQPIAAALELFAAVALLFWYILRIVMELQRR